MWGAVLGVMVTPGSGEGVGIRRRGGYGANMKEFGVQFDGWREAAHKAST